MVHRNDRGHAKRKGVSLAEMCVVLAVVSIVALVVTSFTIMVSARSSVSAAKLKMMEDQQLTKIVLESWVDQMTGANAAITADEDGFTASVGGAEYTVTLEEDRIIAPLPEGKNLFCPLNTVTELRFDQLTSPGDAIYFCTAVYEIPDPAGGKLQREFTFCINPHVGETVG